MTSTGMAGTGRTSAGTLTSGFKLNASILQAQKDIGHFAKAIWVII
jgi:hypothetical protein